MRVLLRVQSAAVDEAIRNENDLEYSPRKFGLVGECTTSASHWHGECT